MAQKVDIERLSAEERAEVEARRAYKKAWREVNKDRVAEHNRRFWAKKAAQIKAESKSE